MRLTLEVRESEGGRKFSISPEPYRGGTGRPDALREQRGKAVSSVTEVGTPPSFHHRSDPLRNILGKERPPLGKDTIEVVRKLHYMELATVEGPPGQFFLRSFAEDLDSY